MPPLRIAFYAGFNDGHRRVSAQQYFGTEFKVAERINFTGALIRVKWRGWSMKRKLRGKAQAYRL